MLNNKKILGAGLVILIVLAVIYGAINYIYWGTLRTSLINSDFSLNKMGWRGSCGELLVESNGNKYVINDYNWGLYQIVTVQPGNAYALSADTRKGTSETAARLAVLFKDSQGEKLPGYSINYWHQGSQWETIPPQIIDVPDGTSKMLIYLLTLKDTGYHCFDNISLKRTMHTMNNTPPIVNINQPLLPAVTDDEILTELPEQITESGAGITHLVIPGDTMSSIAQKYETPIEAIIRANEIKNPSSIYPGQNIFIPGSMD